VKGNSSTTGYLHYYPIGVIGVFTVAQWTDAQWSN